MEIKQTTATVPDNDAVNHKLINRNRQLGNEIKLRAGGKQQRGGKEKSERAPHTQSTRLSSGAQLVL